jgi:hypothetical protein
MRKSCRLNQRTQHGKLWHPIFFQRRDSGDYPLVEQCRRIFIDGLEGNENNQDDSQQSGGHSNEEYKEEGKNATEDGTIVDNAMMPVGATASNTNTGIKLQPYQGQDIKALFDDIFSHMFPGDWDGSISSWEAKVLRRFFSREEGKALVKADGRAWAWLDDREYGTGNRRKHERRMGATDVCSALRLKVCLIMAL